MHIQLTQPATKSMEQCIREAYESCGVAPLGGASTDGWSKMADFQRCPYRYYLMHEPHGIESVVGSEVPTSLQFGALFHAVLAMHYLPSMHDTYPRPYELLDKVANLGADAEIVADVRRLYSSYIMYYAQEIRPAPHFKPLAVELGAGIPGKHTCRFDMLAQIHGATWIVEHKTASREDRTTLESWWLDGEILGEVYGYKLSGLDKVYGPLAGVLINIAIKTKEPKFRRVEVVVTDDLLVSYMGDRAYWNVLRKSMHDAGYWPRKLQGCIGRYDTCTFWDHCRNADATDDARLNRLLQLSLKKGEP